MSRKGRQSAEGGLKHENLVKNEIILETFGIFIFKGGKLHLNLRYYTYDSLEIKLKEPEQFLNKIKNRFFEKISHDFLLIY